MQPLHYDEDLAVRPNQFVFDLHSLRDLERSGHSGRRVYPKGLVYALKQVRARIYGTFGEHQLLPSRIPC